MRKAVTLAAFFIYANNEPKSVLAQDLGDCRGGGGEKGSEQIRGNQLNGLLAPSGGGALVARSG